MSTLDDQYVLSDAERELIASEIKDMGEEDFLHMQPSLKSFERQSKEAIAEKEAAASEEVVAETTEVAEETVASEEVKAEEVTEEAAAEVQETASEEEVIEKAIDQAEQVEAGIPVTAPAEEPTVQDKYKDAFSIDNFDIKL